jgi:hypothetical protein
MLAAVETTLGHGRAPTTPDSAEAAYFLPPVAPSEFDFERWLVERTPAGAPTLAIRAPGARHPLELPQIRAAVPSPRSWRGRRRRGCAAAVHAAYLADIAGLSPRELIRSGFFDFTTDRAARHHVRDGRLTAADLGAWPWAVVDGKPLQRNWWGDHLFALALQTWAERKTGRLAPARSTSAFPGY